MRHVILDHIRRLAAVNNGVAPGRLVFERETGIKYHEWYGIFWSRWGDAIEEAGLTRNALQSKLSKNVVLASVAEACRHYGRFATDGDMRLFAKTWQNFPSHSTIINHYRRADLADALRDLAHTDERYADLKPYLPSAAPKPTVSAKPSNNGSVYLLKSGDFYKIGRSDEVERRIRKFASLCQKLHHWST